MDLEKALIGLILAAISAIVGQWTYTRNRNIKVEQRLTTLENNQLTKSDVKEMIEEAQKPMAAMLQALTIAVEDHKTVTNRLSGLVGELNVKTAVLEEKMRND